MDDKTLAVLIALKTIRQYCEDQDTEVMDLIDELSDTNDKADNAFAERLYSQHTVWGTVGTKVGNMINNTLFEALDKHLASQHGITRKNVGNVENELINGVQE
jgi:hypothetical protein